MAGERRLRILARLVGSGAPELETKRLCEVCAEVTGMTGAGIMLMSGDVPRGSVCTTNEVSALIEQLQYTLGEGPCVDAYHQDRPVLEPDLADPARPAGSPSPARPSRRACGPCSASRSRWEPSASAPSTCTATGRGRSPTTSTPTRWSWPTSPPRPSSCCRPNAPPGKLAAELEAGADFQYVVHQASGMVAAQLDVSVGQALIRLRAYAFGNDRPLAEVAEDVVARRLRFDARSGEKDPGP